MGQSNIGSDVIMVMVMMYSCKLDTIRKGTVIVLVTIEAKDIDSSSTHIIAFGIIYNCRRKTAIQHPFSLLIINSTHNVLLCS